jgi:N-acetyl-gamma-glutamyl-phosphate reductase
MMSLSLGNTARVATKALRSLSTTKTGASRVAILGASGYTGAECCRLIATHPSLEIAVMTAHRYAGKPIDQVFPHLRAMGDLPIMCKVDEADFSDVDAVFCCLPHGTTQDIVASLPKHLKVGWTKQLRCLE